MDFGLQSGDSDGCVVTVIEDMVVLQNPHHVRRETEIKQTETEQAGRQTDRE